MSPPPLSDRDFGQICELIYEKSRIHLDARKRELVVARLGKRLRATGIPTYRAYCDLLRSPAGAREIASFVDVISTNHTFFYREKKHFEFLTHKVLPDFGVGAWSRHETALRCWSAACSSGEEPYTLAIEFARYAEANPRFLWEIDASDISTAVLEKARQGIYDGGRAGLPPELLRRYFQRGVGTYDGRVRVKPELRNRIRWHHLNLFQESFPFAQPFHVIFCRNVMIYFDQPSQQQLVDRLCRCLVPGGYLMIGHSESLTNIRTPLQTVCPATYRKPLR